MQIGILGPLEVRNGDRAVPVAGARLRRLLTRLAADVGRTVPPGELIEAVWQGDPPQDVTNALQSLVSRLRRSLGDAQVIRQVPGGYRLDLDADALDSVRFEQQAHAGGRELRAGAAEAAEETLTAALQLWRGAPFTDAEESAYAIGLSARLDEIRLTALADRVDARLLLGRAADVIAELEELVAAHPLREGFVSRLMAALAATGRTAAALVAYQSLRERLADLLGTDPGQEIQDLHLRLLRGDSAGGATSIQGRRTNLRTALSSFIGRGAELVRIAELVDGGRLTTIVGPGGAGKTRLAVEAARPFLERCHDGVWMVELAPVTDEATIVQAVLSTLGLRDARVLERRGDPVSSGIGATERLFDALADSDALLVIDNCEHLIGGVADLVAEILARCPQVRVLTTSREPLGITGEALCSIPPLDLPPRGATPVEAAGYPAVALLVARGTAASADFALDDTTVAAVVEIVRRLDGLPLAIELAAARLRVLSVGDIAARLTDRFRLLAGGTRTSVARHRTLRAVVEWSWDLLTDSERLLAERLAVFPAGAEVEAATTVCHGGPLAADEIADLLLSLVDKSLLQVDQQGPVRYRMLETIREYGVERLGERGELATARAAHADYFTRLAARLDPELRTARQLEALARFTQERDNMLAALRFLGDSGLTEQVLDLVLALSWYWNITGSHTEMLTWTDFAMAATAGIDSPARTMVEAGQMLAALSTNVAFGTEQHDWDLMRAELQGLGERLARIDDGTNALTRVARVMTAFFSTEQKTIEDLFESSLASPDPWMRAVMLSMHTFFLENSGEVDAMRRDVDLAYAEFEAIGDRWGLSSALTVRAGIRRLDGDVDGAIADYERALAYVEQLGALGDDMLVEIRLAALRLQQGDPAAARRHVDKARRRTEGRPEGLERSILADATLVTVCLEEGDLAGAESLSADLRRRVMTAAARNPLYGHMQAVVGAVCSVAAVRSGDLETARADLAGAYPAAVLTEDLPVLAVLAVAVAVYAEAVGDLVAGAEILGAAARLRGGDDPGDVTVASVRRALSAALGEQAFAAVYAAGRTLDREGCVARVHPDTVRVAAAAERRPG